VSKRRNRKPRKNFTHGAVEKEMRSLHRKGEYVEKQRNLTKALLHAVLVKHGGEVSVTRAQLDEGAKGNSTAEPEGDGVRIVFTLDPVEEGTSGLAIVQPKRSLWARFRALFSWGRS